MTKGHELALLTLAANAPKEPTAAAMREWSEQFERDYPRPEIPAGIAEVTT